MSIEAAKTFCDRKTRELESELADAEDRIRSAIAERDSVRIRLEQATLIRSKLDEDDPIMTAVELLLGPTPQNHQPARKPKKETKKRGKQNSRAERILKFLRSRPNQKPSTRDVIEATGLPRSSVTSCLYGTPEVFEKHEDEQDRINRGKER
jgi:hypothetical protein